MMETPATAKDSQTGEPPWLFHWRGRPKSPFPALVLVALATLAFAFLLVFVRVKVAAPQFEMASKASWLQVPATGDGLVWAMRAKEGGPLLSRYEPTGWNEYPTLEEEVVQATRIAADGYVPKLRELPQSDAPEPLTLAAKGEPVFPRRSGAAAARVKPAAGKLAPVLYPLSALGAAELPQSLPPFAGEIDAAMTAADWRFLLRLHPDGGVADCVSLTKVAGTAPAVLENWLRGVTFDPKLAAGDGWLAVTVKFNNQPSDGTDPR